MNLLSSIQSFFEFFAPVIVLLGLLIFVHELGHFLVAKYYQVRVEVFSLGFGPKLLTYRRGETEYAISAVPLGGYVKMFGDDPTAEISAAEKARSFLHKPVSQRIAIVLAGPLMNLFFAVVVFAMMAGLGERAVAPVLGDISTDSAAAKAGFRSGDTILAVDGQAVQVWESVTRKIEATKAGVLTFKIKRESGEEAEIKAEPTYGPSKNVFSWARTAGAIEGLNLTSRAAVIAVDDPKSAAAEAGLKTGDVIRKIRGQPVSAARHVAPMLASESGYVGGPVDIEVERGLVPRPPGRGTPKTEILQLKLAIPEERGAGSEDEFLAKLGFTDPQMHIASVVEESPAAKAGLAVFDRITAINGMAVTSFDQVVSAIRSFGGEQPLEITVDRGGELKTFAVKPHENERMTDQGKEVRQFEVGITAILFDNPPSTTTRQSEGPVAALVRGAEHSWNWTSLTVLGLVRLFDGSVSSKNVGGLLSIGSMAQKSWKAGVEEFLRIMGIISINLFILNLLPIPVLDGGHLVFYGIEAVRGSPLPMKKLEILQQVGIVLLLGLMIFALYNDIMRIAFG
jgi:regulator of sigma E protease